MDNIKTYPIKDLLQISLPVFPDDRGFFKEVFRLSGVEQALSKPFLAKQVSHARSVKNTLRGIHVASWNKIVYVVKGKVQIVAASTICWKTFGSSRTKLLRIFLSSRILAFLSLLIKTL